MKIGITGAGFGPTASGRLVRAAAQAAERAGFSTFWLGEHTVLFENEAEAHYPDRDSGRRALSQLLDPRTALADPVVAMTWAAAATERIEIGSGVIILPQHNPVVLAKELATLDEFSGGRLVLGAGSGWSPREYAAVGADWKGRGRRMDEYVAVLRALWREHPASFEGETVRFERAYLFPAPTGPIPILFGGESDAALRRVARCGDGWSPVKLALADAPGRIAQLREWTRAAGRDPGALRIVKSLTLRDDVDELARFRDAGVTEFKLSCFGELPGELEPLTRAIEEFGQRYVERVAAL